MKLTDESMMPWGKYQNCKMENVPAMYLIWLGETFYDYDEEKLTESQKAVFEYYKENEDVLKKEDKEVKAKRYDGRTMGVVLFLLLFSVLGQAQYTKEYIKERVKLEIKHFDFQKEDLFGPVEDTRIYGLGLYEVTVVNNKSQKGYYFTQLHALNIDTINQHVVRDKWPYYCNGKYRWIDLFIKEYFSEKLKPGMKGRIVFEILE